jgi:hypothetical protein
MPDFEQTSAAVLAHARCIDETVKTSDVSTGTIEEQAKRIQQSCSSERDKALNLQAVPVFEPTVEQYDELHGGLASNLIAAKRKEPAE